MVIIERWLASMPSANLRALLEYCKPSAYRCPSVYCVSNVRRLSFRHCRRSTWRGPSRSIGCRPTRRTARTTPRRSIACSCWTRETQPTTAHRCERTVEIYTNDSCALYLTYRRHRRRKAHVCFVALQCNPSMQLACCAYGLCAQSRLADPPWR